MNAEESVVLVDSEGSLVGWAPAGAIPDGGICAVELTLVYVPERGEVILLNRGKGANDMVGRWSLQAGKMRRSDLAATDRIGAQLSLDAVRTAAVRELGEELGLKVNPSQLEVVHRFAICDGAKNLFFTLLALSLSSAQLASMTPDQDEVADFGFFTPAQLRSESNLGDAIIYQRERILEYLGDVIADGAAP